MCTLSLLSQPGARQIVSHPEALFWLLSCRRYAGMWLSTLKFCTHPASPPLEGPDLVFIPSPRRFFFSSSSFSSGGGEARRRGAERRQTEAGGPRVVDFGTPGGGREQKGCRCAAGQAAGRGRPGRGRPGGGRPPRGSPGRRPRGAASVQPARPALDLRRVSNRKCTAGRSVPPAPGLEL